jgi:hypothetical protein
MMNDIQTNHAILPPRFMMSKYDDFPDDQDEKDVYLQAHGLAEYPGRGDRHVLIHWTNKKRTDTVAESTLSEDGVVLQVIQLTGQAGNYSYYVPVAQILSQKEISNHTQFLLGRYTRAERDEILNIAKGLKYDRRSVVNGCRVWTRDLLLEMVTREMLSKERFEEVDERIPLVKRRPELKSSEGNASQ